jgi:hypothetical protein
MWEHPASPWDMGKTAALARAPAAERKSPETAREP